MAKPRETYGIRTSLEKGKLDIQIQFGANWGLSIGKKPITVRTFLYAIMALFGYVLLFRFVIGNGGFWGILLTTIGYGMCFYGLFTRTATLDYKKSYVPVLFSYWLSGMRKIKTGLLDSNDPLLEFFGIKEKNGISETGMIYYKDGTVGMILEVVGHASEMIFDSDRNSVLVDTRTFYKNLPTGLTVTLNTRASIQDVRTQVNSKLYQLEHLAIKSKGLEQIIKRQGFMLRNQVGQNFAMTRQFYMVRGLEENVNITVNQMLNCAASSSNMFLKSAKVLRNEKPVYAKDDFVLNEPFQVEAYLKDIFNNGC